MTEVRWERMFPDQLEAAFAARPVVYFTYGLCEPHGPQNTVGLDALKAHGIACAAARESGGIVAPPDYWHCHEIGGFGVWAAREVGEVARTWLTAVPPWDAQVRPRMKVFRSMQPVFGNDQPPAEGSRWRPNWAVPERG